ncbi:hypothetical protein GOP47_0011656 [Adiantum capillus-veneris]|uniref:Uncharacterized protein n=1 Tax=Adiantum capillus-veneris TaxID=13818 RepID=A0A9D4ZFL5_ADICA|nr:hypothetical protein GOP47_0011656 [Adiantum capillus-veneris]
MAGQESVADMEASLSSCKEGPVLTMINKRLRSLRKKYNKILQIEDSKAQGKQINKEQEDVLKGKPAVGVLIEEYEKLRPVLKEELEKEIMEIRLKNSEESTGDDSEERENIDTRVEGVETKAEVDEENAGSERASEGDAVCDEGLPAEKSSNISEDDGSQRREPLESGIVPFEREINDLLHLLYFAQLFDVPLPDASPSLVWTKIHERSSCVSYDCVTEEDASSPLEESDLNDLSLLGSLTTSRPPNATLSHRDALQQCTRHALLWLGNSDAPIKEGLRVTYSQLRERLSRILSSEYYTMIPELQTIGQQTVAAGVSGAGQYPPQLLIHAALTGAGPPLYYASQDAVLESLLQGGEQTTATLPSSNLVSDLPDSQFGVSAASAYVPDSDVPIKGDVEGATDYVTNNEEQEQDLQSASTEPTQGETGQERQDQQQELEATSFNVDLRGYQGPNGNVVTGTSHDRARIIINSRGYGMSRGSQGNGRGSQHLDQRGYYPRNQHARGSIRGMRASGRSNFTGYANGQANNRTSGAPPK